MKLHALMMGFALIASVATANTYEVETKNSRLQWVGSKVIGESHNGTVTFKKGTITFEKDLPKSAHFWVDMTTIKNDDITNATYNQKLVGHLKSADFFAVDKHPTAELIVDSFKKNRDASYNASGTLKIKNITHPITFKAMIDQKKNTLTTEAKFDRTKYDIRYRSAKFFANLGDKIISDDVKLQAKVQFKKSVKIGKK